MDQGKVFGMDLGDGSYTVEVDLAKIEAKVLAAIPHYEALAYALGDHGASIKEALMALKFNLPGKAPAAPPNLKIKKPAQTQEQVEKPKGSLFVGGEKVGEVSDVTIDTGKQNVLAVFGHEEVVDKYLELEAELAPFTDKFKELATLRQTALDLAKETGEEDPELPVYVRGTEKSLVFTKASVANIVTDKEGLMKALKAKVPVEALWDMVKFSQADIKKYLSEVEAAPFMGTTQGPRRFDKVTPNT